MRRFYAIWKSLKRTYDALYVSRSNLGNTTRW